MAKNVALEHHLITIKVKLAAAVGANEWVAANRKKAAAAGDALLGIAVFGGKKDEEILVATDGIHPVKCSAAIAQYKAVQSDTDGKAAELANGKKAGGILLEAAAADGDVVPCQLRIQP